MADESMLDKALGLIPGVGVKKTRPRPPRDKAAVHIASLQKGLAKLARDLDRLSGMVGKEKKPGSGKKAAAAKSRKAPAAKKKR